MLCKIADLITEVPEAGGLAPRCQAYLCSEDIVPDFIIHPELYRPDYYSAHISAENLAYMEAGRLFNAHLIFRQGLMLHSSAVMMDERAYLFSGNSGVGKSTHTRLWKQVFGDAAQVLNDDKPALRRIDGCWYAYGTPWCGKEGINQNVRVPLAGICFLKQSDKNRICRLSVAEALQRVVEQTIYLFDKMEKLDLMLSNIEKLICEIPVFELENCPEAAAARLSYNAMCREADLRGI